VFQNGGNTFYDRKNKIPMKIPEFKFGVPAEVYEQMLIWRAKKILMAGTFSDS
jgi:hypothetical protein